MGAVSCKGALAQTNVQIDGSVGFRGTEVLGGKTSAFFRIGLSTARSTFMAIAYNQFNFNLTQYLSPTTRIYCGAACVRASGPGSRAVAFGSTPSIGRTQALARTAVQVRF